MTEQETIAGLREELRLAKKQNALYEERIAKESAIARERLLSGFEGENADRIRKEARAGLRDLVNAIRIASNRLPSITDALATFEATDWQRVQETRERMRKFDQELQYLLDAASVVESDTTVPFGTAHFP